jgi:hypothetical protein
LEGNTINNFQNGLDWGLVGYPSKSAIESILQAYGFSFEYYDWLSKGIEDWTEIPDYRDNVRYTIRAKNLNYF